MTRIRTFALLAFAAVLAACSQPGPTSDSAPDEATYAETETCRGGWITSSGRWVCPGDPEEETGEQ
jgi:ABC-type glycerol-3-phosphate transport system substrate-binding protein